MASLKKERERGKKAQLVYYHLNGRGTCQGAQVKTHRTRRKNIVKNAGEEASIHVSMDYTQFTQA